MKAIARLLFLALVAESLLAQSPPERERGFKSDLVYQFADIDSLNLFNGNLNLAIPLATYPVSADVSYSFVLRYAGNVWHDVERCTVRPHGEEQCTVNWLAVSDNAGIGWGLSFGQFREIPSVYAFGEAVTWMYVSPDGAEHNFYHTLHEPVCSQWITDDCDEKVAGIMYTRDGSYLRLREVTDAKIVEFPDGQRHRFFFEPRTSEWRIRYIYGVSSQLNASGEPTTNYVKFDYVENPASSVLVDWHISDSHGRAHKVIFEHSATHVRTGFVDKIQLAAFRRPEDSSDAAAVAEYNLTYDNPDFDVNGPESVIAKPYGTVVNTINVRFLRRLTLPSGELWRFDFHQPETVPDPSSATLTKVTLPTLGSLNYTYQQYTQLTSTDAPVGIKDRTHVDSSSNVEQYRRYTLDTSGRILVDTMARIDSTWRPESRVVNHFNYAYGTALFALPFNPSLTDGSGRYLSSETYRCTPSTNLCSAEPEQRSYVRYELDAPIGTACHGDYPCARERNRRVVSERTFHVTDANRHAFVDRSLFDGLGHYRKTVTGGNYASGNVRETFTGFNLNTLDYDPESELGMSVGNYVLSSSGARLPGYTMLLSTDSWILNTFTTSYVHENGVTADTLACFDPMSGFLRTKRTRRGDGIGGSNDLFTVYTRDSASGYVAREELFGGDRQSVDDATELCSLTPAHGDGSYRIDFTTQYGTLKTKRYVNGVTSTAMPFYSVENSIIDRNTGLVKESRDVSGRATGYLYDRMGRLTSISPPDVAATTYTYTNATSTTAASVEASTGSGSLRTAQAWQFDSFGRISIEKRLMPDGTWSGRRTTYDTAGRRQSVSEQEQIVGTSFQPVHKTTFSNYDHFGRVGAIQTADGKSTTFTYVGDRKTTRTFEVAMPAGDSLRSVTEERDRAGRLIRVIEDDGGLAATTNYTYDEGKRLASVTMNGSTTTQVRLFDYDRSGLLRSETHPESGTTSYQYDAAGNIVTRTTPVATLTSTYDRAGRLASVTQDGVGPLKVFLHDRPNSLGDWSVGKLDTATRYNRSAELGNVAVVETYTYGGLGGRLSVKNTRVSRPSGDVASFDDQYSYNTAGDLASVTYPLCSSGTCLSLSAPFRTVSSSYRHGMVTDVPPYTQGFQNATGITYHPNAIVSTIEHRNVAGTTGPRLQQAIAGNMPRPASIAVTNFCEGLSVSAPAPQPKSVTYNSPAGLSVTASGATSYQWYRVVGTSTTALSGQTTSTLTVAVTETSIYFVRAGNGVCTVDSERATVTVLSCTPPDATISAPSSITASMTATASVPGTTGATYQWSIPGGGTIVSGQGTNEITFRANCTGPVSLAATVSKDGCSSSDTHAVSVSPATVAMSAVGATTILQGGSVQIRLTFTGAGPWTVTWSDLPSQPQTIQPEHNPHTRTLSPAVTTSYSVTAVDQYACAMTVSGSPITIAVKPPAPWGVQATAGSTTQVTVTWGFSGSADRFDIYRSGTVSAVGSVSPTAFTFTDPGVAVSSSYVYTVRAVKASTESDASAGDLATTVIFADHPATSFVTAIQAQHITQLQTAVNAVRTAAGLSPQSFPPITAGVTVVSASHIEGLRTALAPARTALGLPPAAYTRSPLVAGMVVLASDVNDTRGGVR